MDSVREAAMLALYEADKNGAYINLAVKDTLASRQDFSAQDKAFFTNLVYGTVKRQISIDYIIGCFSKVKLKKISPYILAILRLGIYQLKFTDKIPASAAVNESVKLARRYGHSASAGFVNGLLRNVAKSEIKYPEKEIQYLSVKHSFPEWIVEKWVLDYGIEFAESLMEAMNSEPAVTLRVNRLKTTAEELVKKLPGAEISEIYPYAVHTAGFDIGNAPEYKNGEFIAQDISAMMAAEVLNPKPGEAVLDICSAPGGKTTQMAELMENRGTLIATDLHEHKIKIIQENAARMGIDIINAVLADATVENPEYIGKFDKVLADVPCSGLGIIRKKPDIKLKKEENDIPALQYSILENAAKYVKAGGELLYSTCTIEKRENEAVILRFLENHSDFSPVDITENLPKVLQKPEAKKGYVTFYPNTDAIDGFFIAKIKRCAND